MGKFAYVAKGVDGQQVNGTIKAQDLQAARNNLKNQSLTVTKLEEIKGFDINNLQIGGTRVKLEEMVIFTRQMATMIGAGIALLEALEIMEEQMDNKGFKTALGEIVDNVRSGSDLSESLRAHPKIFPEIYVNMIKAGEASGQLDSILDRLAGYMEATAKLKREIKSAMTYPVISLLMIIGITGFLLIKIVPKFVEIFNNMELQLPAVTAFVIQLSEFLQTRWYTIIIGAIVFGVGLKLYKRTETGSYNVDWIMLKVPVFGQLFQKVAISRFSKTFSTLLVSGVPVLGALEIVASTAGNKVVSTAVYGAREAVRQGEQLSGPLADSPVFPPMVIRMISIGEKSGALETLLEKISEFYDEQVEATVGALTSLIEPLMIGAMGGIVGTIVLAIFLPIFDIQKQLSKG